MRKSLGILTLLILSLVALEALSRWAIWTPSGYVNIGTPRQGFSSQAHGDWVPNQDAIWVDRITHPFYVHINGDGLIVSHPVVYEAA